jgi:hypothetical protein
MQLMALLAAASLLMAAAPAAEPASEPYFQLKQDRIDAYRNGDRAFFADLLADGFVGLGPDGQFTTKQDYLDRTFHGDQRARLTTETQVSDFHATRHGELLVMTYEEIERTDVGGHVFREHLRRVDVYRLETGRWRLQAMTAVAVPEIPTAIEVPAERLADYAGTYRFGPELVSTVRLDRGMLLEQTSGQAETALIPVGPDTFYATGDIQGRVIFERDAAGTVAAQIYQSGSQKLRAPREAR